MTILGTFVRTAVTNASKSPTVFITRRFNTTYKMATTYTLKYFPFRVLGEPIRWQFVSAGVPFVDERLPRETWDSDENGKHHIGWGRLPLLVVDNDEGKFEITQSCAISRYLAGEFGQLPDTPLLRTRADELVDNLQDLRLWWRPYVRELDPEKKAILAQEMVDFHFPFYLPRTEAFMLKHGQNGFAIGDKLCWADFYVANFTQLWEEHHGDKIFEKTPFLKAHMEKIINIPSIKEWIHNRPKTKL